MKYIDAEKLKERISRLRNEFIKKSETKGYTTLEYLHKAEGLSLALQHIASLQQEQPEVDLDREIIKYKVPFTDEREYLNETTLDAIARHFAEWGAIHLNARKEE